MVLEVSSGTATDGALLHRARGEKWADRGEMRALLFDAAGTLIEPVEPVAAVYSRIAAGEGLEVAAGDVGRAFGRVFRSVGEPEWDAESDGDAAERQWWERVVAETLAEASGGPLPSSTARRCFEALFSHYALPTAWRVFPEVADVLGEAQARGWQVAVVSNFDRRLHGILDGFGLRFDAVVTSADTQSRKPDPRIFWQALELLGRSPGEVLHVGDSREADLGGAQAAGIEAFLVERPTTDLRGFFRWAAER